MNAHNWFYSQSFNGRADVSEDQPHKIIHMGTGNLVSRFPNRAEAEKWLASYAVSQSYKNENYRIVPA